MRIPHCAECVCGCVCFFIFKCDSIYGWCLHTIGKDDTEKDRTLTTRTISKSPLTPLTQTSPPHPLSHYKNANHLLLNLSHVPSESTSEIMTPTSFSSMSCPRVFMTEANSEVDTVPEQSSSKMSKASLNSRTCSSFRPSWAFRV